MNVLFLLGAGVSFDALPHSRFIGKTVLSRRDPDGKVFFAHSSRSFAYDVPGAGWVDWQGGAERIAAFLRFLQVNLKLDEADYEGLYFACQQMHDAEVEYENPLLLPFMLQCTRWLNSTYPQPEYEDFPELRQDPELRLQQLCRESMEYITDVVTTALTPRSPVPAALLAQLHRPLLEAWSDISRESSGHIDVVTLNHDTLLERSLRLERLKTDEGFRRSRGDREPAGIRVARLYKRGKKAPRLRLVKLHGSIDWHWVRPDPYAPDETRLARLPKAVLRLRHPEVADGLGRPWQPLNSRPELLIGTHNKMLDYVRPVHLRTLTVFRRSLMRCNGIVVAGYSFRDKGVNMLLDDTLSGGNRKVVVIGPSVGPGAPDTARPLIQDAWDRWISEGRLLPMKSTFAKADWPTLHAHLAGAWPLVAAS